MELSILICSIESRRAQCESLVKSLLASGRVFEYVNFPVSGNEIVTHNLGHFEIIIATDNKQMKVGDKRNLLLRQATGEYVAFVDDDDKVSGNYIEMLLRGIKTNCDVVVFDAKYYHNGKYDRPVIYGIEHRHDSNQAHCYYRIPNHLMCVKRELALRVGFKPISFGEDADYARRLLPHLKTQQRINTFLYEYWFNDKTTETQRR